MSRQSHGVQDRIGLSFCRRSGSFRDCQQRRLNRKVQLFPDWSTDGSSPSFSFAGVASCDLMPRATNSCYIGRLCTHLCNRTRQIKWSKNPNTGPLEFATVVGDRGKPGLYIQLVRWPPHAIYKAHSHPDHRYAVVLRGTFYHGFGDKFDESKFEARPAGTFFTEPKGVRHFGMTKDEGTVLYFVGTGPSTNDDPEK